MRAYYNELDAVKAEVLREAIRAGAIAPGDVDERSVADVESADLVGYTQCHFFAGGGFWSLALRQAGWPDDREVWTGSCPCPSFSAAGKGQGFRDPRHLWPHWARLIAERRPAVVFGEQVSAAIGHGWLDLVQTDLETQNYAVGKAVLGACSVGAPHIRQRLYFVATTCGGANRSYTGDDRLADAADPRRQTAWQHGSRLPLLPPRPEQRGHAEQLVATDPVGLRGRWPSGAGDEPSTLERSGRLCAACIVEHAEERRRGIGWHEAGTGNSGYADGADFAGSLGDAGGTGLPHRQPEELRRARRRQEGRATTQPSEASGGLADTDGGISGDRGLQRGGQHGQQPENGGAGGVAEPLHAERWPFDVDGPDGRDREDAGRQEAHGLFGTRSEVRRPGALNGFWAGADWIGCRDGKFRPVPGTTQSGPLGLVNGDSADLGYFLLPGGQGYAFSPLIQKGKERTGRLRLYGDAICVPAARAFIEAFLETVSK